MKSDQLERAADWLRFSFSLSFFQSQIQNLYEFSHIAIGQSFWTGATRQAAAPSTEKVTSEQTLSRGNFLGGGSGAWWC